MKNYSLYKLFHIDQNEYKEEYDKRFNSEKTVKLKIKICGNQAFFCPTDDLYKKIISIERNDKKINQLCTILPQQAINQFAMRCLIDEIILSNNIEGVHSTRKEVSEILMDLSKENKHKRFNGLVKKYALLMSNENIPINTCQDIRKIYDDIFYEEIKESDPKSLPDGDVFRKDGVSVYSSTGKEIHKGMLPEAKIISEMNEAINILLDKNIDFLIRVSIFHYFFGYIHPFYDGNGRTSRFISSYLLSHELNHIIGYRISYTIKEKIKDYYEAFKICNHPNNKADLTPFVEMFLNIIDISTEQLKQALEKRVNLLDHYRNIIDKLPYGDNEKYTDIYYLLIQAALFADSGISTQDLLSMTNLSRNTINSRLEKIPSELLQKKKDGTINYYSLNLTEADKYVEEHS
ncbi:Fic family protein [uncultured Ruminococcus sp.]|uniref:Fic family protein n=1 Tax=uncultured Ruminococcus sp. TaxID=165186 RepID=UPI002629E750|nr:Fic family protein [uncultured Ruminococcus sp.]